SLGLMPFFIEFLKTSGLFDQWVEDCPLHYTSGNAPAKRDVLGTLVLAALAGHWRYAFVAHIRMVLDMEVQAGNQTAPLYAQPELWAFLDGLAEQERPVFLRGDSHWGSEKAMVGAEERKLGYLFKLKQSANVRKLIGQIFRK